MSSRTPRFGLALGATLTATHIPPLIAWSSSPLLFSGAAQLLAVQLLDAGASAGVVVLGSLVVNARMLLYGVALARTPPHGPAIWAPLFTTLRHFRLLAVTFPATVCLTRSPSGAGRHASTPVG